MEWPPQSPDLNIIEHLLCILERQVRNRFPPPSCMKELEQVSMEEWPKIPLDEVRKLYDSTPRRIEAVQKAAAGPTTYQINFLCQLFYPTPVYYIYTCVYIYIYIW